jgi:putative flippase GtrA
MQTTLARLSAALPSPLRRRATEARLALLAQLVMFASVGVAGLLVDVATVYALRGELGLYYAGLASYLTAVTATFALNRAWTFRDANPSGSLISQWAKFLAANTVGFALNRSAYAALVTFSPLCAAQPVYAVAAGAVAGLGANFTLSRRLVFRQ